MTGTTTFPLVRGATMIGSWGSVAPVEKSCSGNSLHDGANDSRKRRDDSMPRMSTRELSHSETGSASRWYGPRLSAPFVAQILGQVLAPSEPDMRGARTAYEGAVMRQTGGIFDRSF